MVFVMLLLDILNRIAMNATAVFNDYSAPQTLAQALDSLEHLNVTIAASFEKISQSVSDKTMILQTSVKTMIANTNMHVL